VLVEEIIQLLTHLHQQAVDTVEVMVVLVAEVVVLVVEETLRAVTLAQVVALEFQIKVVMEEAEQRRAAILVAEVVALVA
jgi:hypothetical protein